MNKYINMAGSDGTASTTYGATYNTTYNATNRVMIPIDLNDIERVFHSFAHAANGNSIYRAINRFLKV